MRTLIILPILILLAAGCRALDSYPGHRSATAAVQTYIIALNKGDQQTAYRTMTEGFRERLTFEEFQVRDFSSYRFMLPREENYGIQDLNIEGDAAVVTYYIGHYTVLQPVARQADGTWRLPDFGTILTR